jgi:guanosine-3',5'-bis(diphosphate) 3'-pyrophosphohydrolase
MNDEERYAKALTFAAKKHEGQNRIGGLPYITHPVAVARMLREQGYGIDYQITGLFHDLLEDTDADIAEITALGGKDVAEAVKLLTKKDGYIMAEYVAGIQENPMAMAVKAADRLHNLQCAVMADQGFRRRYILESIEWYQDFSPEIPKAIKALIQTLDSPMTGLPPEYQSIACKGTHTALK